MVDLPSRWEVVAYLIGPTTHPVDSCPLPSLRSYLAIRKPQRFLPAPGTVLQWRVVRISTGDTLQSGTTTVGADGLVTVPNITVYRNPDKVRIIFRNPLVGVTETPALPFAFALHQNYPNPFNPTTTIRYDLPSAGLVSLEVFDILGREVRTLVNEKLQAGSYERTFDASGLASGVYFYRLNAGPFLQTRKFILAK
ncbi:MAG: T9SS type A sorting domain-containing protein [Bacteroidota bacterium]